MDRSAVAIPLNVVDGGTAPFDERVLANLAGPLTPLSVDTVQVNIGLRCNLACRHCHVESSPSRNEEMDWPTMQSVLAAARRCNAKVLDITGGEPEMHPRFSDFVEAALQQHLRVIVRTNLTILLEPGHEHLPRYFAERGIHLIASLPCYQESNVDKQRGKHTYSASIEAIRLLNKQGYGSDPWLELDLVYNPGGPSLPPNQSALENDYRRELMARYGIHFTRLYTITNMAIGRFHEDLKRQGRAEAYQKLLRDAFNSATLPGLMCRHQLHVGHDGRLYDCDFNFAIGLPVRGPVRHVRDFEPAAFLRRIIATGQHCFGCTAGCGSSCQGALA